MDTRRVIGRQWLGVVVVAFGAVAYAGSPEDAVRAYMTAYQQGGSKAIAEFLHPAELVRLKNILMPMFRRAPEGEFKQVAQMFFGKNITLEKLEAMAPSEFAIQFMRPVDEQSAGKP